MACVNLNGMLIDISDSGTHIAEYLDHAADIADVGNILDPADILRQQRSRNNSNGSILGAADINRAAQPVAALYN